MKHIKQILIFAIYWKQSKHDRRARFPVAILALGDGIVVAIQKNAGLLRRTLPNAAWNLSPRA